MNLDGAMRIASGGLMNIDRQLALIAQNVANADTPDYARQVGSQQNLTADGQGLGVVSGPSVRKIDTALQAALFSQDGTVAALSVTRSALRSIDAAHGTPGQGEDLPSRLGVLRDGFSALLSDPGQQAQQSQVLAAATDLVGHINTLGDTYTAQRQTAHDDAVVAMKELTTSLDTIGTLTARIVALKSGGLSTTDLENQRDAALHTVAGLVSVKALVRDNGDMLVVTEAGLALPTRDAAGALTLDPANLHAATYYPGGGLSGITLRGQDVTRQMTGGRIGADIMLRDRTIPTFQAELDEFAAGLARRFDVQGLKLFTDPTGAVPAAVTQVAGVPPVQTGYVGFASTIQVSAAVIAKPSLLRDGTGTVVDDPAGASAFTPNPATGPTGFTTLIRRVLDQTFGAEAQPGVAHPAPRITGLGPGGTLTAPYLAPATLDDFARTVVVAQANVSAETEARETTETALRDRLSERHTNISKVNLDTEMALMLTLQTAYGATARVLTVIQGLIDDLMNTLR
jgi:flagellar hook-associated protein 1 FlgK